MIGPRLVLFIAVPTIALLVLLGLLLTADAQSLLTLRSFHATSDSIDDLVEARARLQTERHEALLPTSAAEETSNPEVETILDLMQRQNVDGANDFRQNLLVARELAENNRLSQAVLAYNELIDHLSEAIDRRLDDAPLGLALQRSDALRALLWSEEAFLREDLEARSVSPSPIALTRLHTSASEALDRYSLHATDAGAQSLEDLTVSSSWRTLTLMRSTSFAGDISRVDVQRWGYSAEVRRLSFTLLVHQETQALQDDIGQTVDAEMRRLSMLGGIVVLVIAIAAFGALRLRRSIVGPLSSLTVNARLLSRGELAPIDDPALDEIAEVAHAFSSLSTTMERLWTDVDAVSSAVADRDYDRRIDTSLLKGDWLRLATTMNQTLATGEAHRDAVKEELDRRVVMTDISNTALLAESASDLTAAVLRHLPQVLPGSHAHLHEHPSGPPLFDLGVRLESSISALEVPTHTDHASQVRLRDGAGVASLIEFPEGPPAVLVLRFGKTVPAQVEPLVSLMETAGQILAQAHRRQAAETRATYTQEHDLLTGLPNSMHLRRWFADHSNRSAAWVALGVQPQRLDDWDDVFGRDARELVFRVIASVLDDVVAICASDTRSEIALARVGEPEFVILVPAEHVRVVTDAISHAFARSLNVQGAQINVDLTIGVDHIGTADPDLTQTVANVSAAIRNGDGRATEIIEFEARHREEVRRRADLVSWLSHAIENRDLSVHFQPVVNATTTATEGYECLVRGSKDGENISPAEFIPIAEETNMIVAIGEFVLREACAALPFLRGERPYVAVNLSPIELSNPQLLVRIEQILNESAVDRNRVVFEVTEGATTSASDVELLKKIRALGVKIAIDDFGSGQSNLSYLNTLPAQILKLDRSLVTPMVDDAGAASVVKKAIEMAHDLGMTVVGEGVEVNEELDALRRVRCDLIQGWLTGRPGPLENFIEITIDRPVTRINVPKDSR